MKNIRRPGWVTFACITGFTAVLVNVPTIFSPFIKSAGLIYPALWGILVALLFISVVGAWNMKKWGVYWYFTGFLLQQSLGLLIDNWSVFQFTAGVIFLSVMMFFYKRMDENL